MAEELYRRYRPTSFRQVVGQDTAVQSLMVMGKAGKIPHCLLFTGPSGCGKTTLARILVSKLKCSAMDFYEVNAAEQRGIDSIRDIKARMGLAPVAGDARVWLLDEAHNLTPDAQTSLLKILEDTPDHVYFMLATTDKHKLKKTIITRSTEIACKDIGKPDLCKLMASIVEQEKAEVSDKLIRRISEVAEGSARKALVILHQVIGIGNEDERMAAVEASDIRGQAIDIARALMNSKTSWNDMSTVLSKCDEDAESVRHLVLAYCRTVLLKSGNPRAATIIDEFRDNYFDSKKAGLVLSCWNVIRG